MDLKNIRKELLRLLNKSVKEMEDNRLLLLIREDIIHQEDNYLYKEMYHALRKLRDRLKGGESAVIIMREKIDVFVKHESFFMDLFDTHSYPNLFELYEYEVR